MPAAPGLFSAVNRQPPTANCQLPLAFSLIEMMITVALLSFIVVGLTAMFVQTQRAFRGGMAQSDVLDAGRATADLLTRELEQASPAGLGDVVNFFAQTNCFSAQSLPGSAQSRTNLVSQLFFLTRNNQTWTGNGYVVAVPSNSLNMVNVGTLYHYQASAPISDRFAISNLCHNFQVNAYNAIYGSISANLHRVADGVLHLRLQTYSCTTNYYTINGTLITPNNGNGFYNTNFLPTTTNQQNTIYAQYFNLYGQSYSAFTSNALPAYVNLDLAVLEHEAWEKFSSLPVGAAQQQYLAREQTAGRIHVFRRHIALPNVDPAAYR